MEERERVIGWILEMLRSIQSIKALMRVYRFVQALYKHEALAERHHQQDPLY